MATFINTDNDTYTNINLIEEIKMGEDVNGRYIKFKIKDKSFQKVYESGNDKLYQYLFSICID